MPEKHLDKFLACVILAVSFFGSLAKALDDGECRKFCWSHFLIQLTIGTIAGMIFGLFACWIVGENVYAVGGLSGAGSFLGVRGLRGLSLTIEKYFQSKIK